LYNNNNNLKYKFIKKVSGEKAVCIKTQKNDLVDVKSERGRELACLVTTNTEKSQKH